MWRQIQNTIKLDLTKRGVFMFISMHLIVCYSRNGFDSDLCCSLLFVVQVWPEHWTFTQMYHSHIPVHEKYDSDTHYSVCYTHLLPKQLTDCPQKANISPRGVRELIVLAVYIDTGEKSVIQRKNVKTSDPICVSLHKCPQILIYFFGPVFLKSI